MKKHISLFITSLVATAAFSMNAPVAEANYGQYGQYGQYGSDGIQPGQSIIIDKLVAEPGSVNKGGDATGVYKDNLSLTDKKFKPGEQAVFKIVTKNVSNVTLKNVVVRDYVPTYMEPMVGPGSYDKNTRIITYTISELKPGQEDVQYVKMQIYPQDKLPADQGIVKFVNKVDAKADSAFDEDTTQLFAEKEIIGITEVPKTGPELGLAFLALQAAGLSAGLFLRKSSNKKST